MMAPEKTKPKHVRKAPDFIDDNFIKSLPKDKQEYWARRKEGKNGQVNQKPPTKLFKAPVDVTMGFSNNGSMYAKTRATRRQKQATDNWHTKATHSINKIRNKK